MSVDTYGTLFIVSTPIGNLADMTPRAVECLRSVSLIACEDTRRTGLLCAKLDCRNRYLSYNDVNAVSRIGAIMEVLSRGEDVALVSDAGTPGISDPAYRLVAAAVRDGVTVVAIPGASAALSALVVSGFPLDRFVFEGFLPQKGAKRAKRLAALASEPRTMILYESPYRILKLLELIRDTFGDREVSVSRELTKLHEETVRGPVTAVLARLEGKKPRGEYTVVIRGAEED